MSEDTLDLVIIGGGPAGSLLASLVRRQNPERRVLVLEKEIFPRHHIGESTIPSWRNILERAGVLETLEAAGLMRKVGTLFQWGAADDERWTIDFRDKNTGGASPGSYQVDRAQFDHLVLQHARSLGAEVIEGAAVKAAKREPDAITVEWEQDGARRSARTRYLVDASGQARVLTRLWGLKLTPFDDMNNFAVYGYWKGSAIARFAGPPIHEHERWTYITTCPDGWVWHIPTFPDLVSVGVVTDADAIPSGGARALEEFYLRNVRAADGVGELLEGAELVAHPQLDARITTIRDWAYHASQACGPGWFLCGDAAAFVDPILSSGMLLAANGASLAANALNTLWNDPSVDVELLRESYQSTYDDMAESYHRMARVWYTRNFKYETWHWEAKRQRLRTGRHPAHETDARAFMQLCIGSFANPVEGTFADRGPLLDFLRADARIYAAHLFKGEVGDEEIGREGVDEDEVKRRIEAESRARWNVLLDREVTATGCAGRARESYFTDSTMDRWQRVRYVEVRAEPCVDAFDRVVFPVTPDLPEGIVPLLAPRPDAPGRTLRSILRELGAARPHGSTEQRLLLQLAQQQILQLDLRGWLTVSEAPAAQAREGAWPEVILALVRRMPGARAEMDLAGDALSITLSPPVARDRAGLVLVPASRADAKYVWMQTATTAFMYRGDIKRVGPVGEALVRATRAWEAAHPEAARAWWSEGAPALAGHAIDAASLGR